MRYAIIAAGEGSRLKNEGVTDPKPLVKVNGERILDRLTRIFMANGAQDIVVITNGHHPEVRQRLEELRQEGMPLRYVVKSTESSMHSLNEIAPMLTGERFILTTVDTIFDEELFEGFVREFSNTSADALMAVTRHCDDEKPLYVSTQGDASEALPLITGFHDTTDGIPAVNDIYISAGIYGLTHPTLQTLKRCIDKGVSRMRNFQRELIADGYTLRAYPLGTVMDIDHSSDIKKADAFLKTRRIVGIYRAKRFSPGSVEKDKAILDATLSMLRKKGHEVSCISEEELLTAGTLPEARLYLSMARSEEALAMLEGMPCINAADAVRYCNHRRYIKQGDVTAPLWVKRADQCREQQDDVAFCPTEKDKNETIAQLKARGIVDYVMQQHYEGEHIKFYGVRGTTFFYPKGEESLRTTANEMAEEARLTIYGGDAIRTQKGEMHIIDLNDWPSFSSCVTEAASAIASII